MRMSPCAAANALDVLAAEVETRAADVVREVGRMAEQWARLKDLGGEREDYASPLLGNVQKSLAGLERFLEICGQQIEATKGVTT